MTTWITLQSSMLHLQVNYDYGFPRSLKEHNRGKTILKTCRGVKASVACAFGNVCPALQNCFRNAHAFSGIPGQDSTGRVCVPEQLHCVPAACSTVPQRPPAAFSERHTVQLRQTA